MTTHVSIDDHKKTLNKYYSEFGISPSGANNLHHLEEWLKKELATIYKYPVEKASDISVTDRYFTNIFIQEHWDHAVEVYLRRIQEINLTLSSVEDIDNFIWEYGEELYAYSLVFAKKTLSEVISKYIDDNEVDICETQSLGEFLSGIYEEVGEKLGRNNDEVRGF